MSRYWIYLNDDVAGPFAVEDLVRQRGFSRTARVCQERPQGGAGEWMSASDIPELARLFKAADAYNEADATPSPAPASAKPARRPTTSLPRMVDPSPSPRRSARRGVPWGGLSLVVLLLGGAAGAFWKYQHEAKRANEAAAQTLVAETTLPAGSADRTIRAWLDRERRQPRWVVERTPEGLYHVTMSWFDPATRARSQVYAFEVNSEALLVKGLNTAAVRLLSEGPPGAARESASSPRAAPAPAKPKPKRDLDQVFLGTIDARQRAVESGDFAAVWSLFSSRKRSEMITAGISESGFVQLQTLRHKLDAGMVQRMLKWKAESPDLRWALIEQTHPTHGRWLIKQRWVHEDEDWRLDHEEQRSADASSNAPVPPPPSSPAASSSSSSKSIPLQSLPGLSN